MKHVVSGGTDAAAMALFDPAALPEDFDQRLSDDAADLMRELTANGKAVWIETGGDGAFLLHAFVNEETPAALQAHLRDELALERFAVPSGRVVFAGVEYVFKDDESRLRKHSHMGGAFEVPLGEYGLSLFRAEYPEEAMENELRKMTTPAAFRLHQSMGWFVLLAVIGVVGLITSVFAAGARAALIPAGALLVALPFIVHRLPNYRRTEARWKEIQNKPVEGPLSPFCVL